MLRHNHHSETVKPIKFLDGIILTGIQEQGIGDENYEVTLYSSLLGIQNDSDTNK